METPQKVEGKQPGSEEKTLSFLLSASRFLTAAFLLFLATFAGSEEPPSYIIQAADRNRVQFQSGPWIKLIGVDMRNLASAKRPALLFAEEVTGFLRALAGRTAYVELDDANAPVSHKEQGDILAYLYYLEPVEYVVPGAPSPAGIQPVLVVEDARASADGTIQTQVAPYERRMLNLELIRKGYARVDRSRSFKYETEFTRAEEEARNTHAGIWE